MELEIPQRHVFVDYTIHFNGPMGFGVREATEVLSLQMSRDHGREMPFYLFIFMPNAIVVKYPNHLFWTYVYNIHFLVLGHSSSSTFGLHLIK